MKKLLLFVLFVWPLLVAGAVAQEHYTEGPVWQVTLVKILPGQDDAYFSSIRERSKPFLEEEKRQGMILDYKYFLNTTQHDPNDWNIALAVQYKNFAALDGLTAKAEALRDRIFGSKQSAIQLNQKRTEMRQIVGSMVMREITLK